MAGRNDPRRPPAPLTGWPVSRRASPQRWRGIRPADLLWRLGRGDVEVHDDRFLAAPHHHAGERLVRAGVDLLVRDERRHEDEVAGAGLGDELESVAPPHASPAVHDVDDALQLSVMVGARLRVRVDRHGSRPDPLRTNSGVGDRGRARHSRGLRCVEIELARADDPHPVVPPAGARAFDRSCVTPKRTLDDPRGAAVQPHRSRDLGPRRARRARAHTGTRPVGRTGSAPMHACAGAMTLRAQAWRTGRRGLEKPLDRLTPLSVKWVCLDITLESREVMSSPPRPRASTRPPTPARTDAGVSSEERL